MFNRSVNHANLTKFSFIEEIVIYSYINVGHKIP